MLKATEIKLRIYETDVDQVQAVKEIRYEFEVQSEKCLTNYSIVIRPCIKPLEHLGRNSSAESHYDDHATEFNSASESKKTEGKNVENVGINISMASKLNTQETKAREINSALSKAKQQ